MGIQDKDNELTESELKLYLGGTFVLAGLLVVTFFLSGVIAPLMLLQIRLTILSLGSVYYLCIYFYHIRLTKHIQQTLVATHNDIIIIFNGRELGRK